MEIDIKQGEWKLNRSVAVPRLGSLGWVVLLALMAWGTYILHGILFIDGLDYIHGDMGDSRLVALFLENSYKYFSTFGQMTSFWSPPWIYYPFKNGMALADNLTGGLWLYAPWRVLGFSEMTSYQFWFLGTSVANCVAFFLFGRELRFSTLGLCAGTYLVGFGMPNAAFILHPQLLSNYYVSLTLLFAVRSVRETELRLGLKYAAWAALFYALQFWTGFYQSWFFTFSASIMVLILAALNWGVFTDRFKTLFLRGMVFVGIAGVLIFPLVRRYLLIKDMMGQRPWEEVSAYLPTWKAILLPVAGTHIYKDMLFEKFFSSFKFFSEMCMFAGFVVLAAPLLFAMTRFWRRRLNGYEPFLAGVALVIPTLLILTLKWDEASLWKFIYTLVPGASAVRAVGRISLTILLFSSILIGYIVTTLEVRGKTWSTALAILIVVGIFIENQVAHSYAFKKSEHLQRIESYTQELKKKGDCAVFHLGFRGEFDPRREVDAMWTSMVTNIPTSNGYSGSMPPRYWEYEIYKAVGVEKLDNWFSMMNHSIPKEKICFIP